MYAFTLQTLGDKVMFAEKVLGSVGKGLDKIKIETTPEQKSKYGKGPWYETVMLELALENYENRAEENEYYSIVSLRSVLNRKSINIK